MFFGPSEKKKKKYKTKKSKKGLAASIFGQQGRRKNKEIRGNRCPAMLSAKRSKKEIKNKR